MKQLFKEKKLFKVMAIAITLPSLILMVALFFYELSRKNVLTQNQAIIGMLLVIGNSIISLIYYAYRKKN